MKRRHQVVLFAVLLLSLTILSPSFDFRGTPQNQEGDQENSTFPNTSSRNENQQVPVEIVVSMSEKEFQVFSKIANQVAEARMVEIDLRNLETDTYKNVLEDELAVGDSGDIILLDSTEVQGYAKRGHLYPLNATTLSKTLGESVSRLREKTEWNGYQWAMPFDFDPYVLASRSDAVAEAGLERLPQNLDEWTKLLNQMGERTREMLTININDPCAADAWLNEFGPGVAPSALKNTTEASTTGGYEQALQVLNRIQPYIKPLNADPGVNDTVMQEQSILIVTRFSQLLEGDQMLNEDKGSPTNQIMFKPLAAIKSRSFVITSGSHEAEQASRWIEGMISASTQSDWYQQAHHLPAKQQQLNLESQKLTDGRQMIGGQEWFVSETSEKDVIESPMQLLQYKKKIQQFLQGEISANQYVSGILQIHHSSK
ncbi:ABC transporter substrate-binding protein [Paenibacillus xylanilyticus]|uniref:ABC transporter substrate-binding protein n=1 Tax=Paenibacillus xylanilyticus TaxID=248903 RepID=UPI0039A2AC9F